MPFLLVASALALTVTAGLLFALLRAPREGDGQAAAIYEDQLAEVARDEASGLLGPAEAAQARAEVERRLLDAARRARAEAPRAGRLPRFATALAVGALPLAATGLYLASGNPGLPDTDFASRAQPLPTLASLRARLADDPDDLEGWVALGDALTAEGRRAEAAPAYAEAVRLTGGRDRRLAGAYAEALALDAGVVTPEAEEIFAAILAAHPDDPQATYYVAQAKAARGERASAVADLQRLMATADPSAPWYAGVGLLLTELTGASGGPPPPPDAAAGPTPAQVEAANALPAGEREAMIRGMVERLDARLRNEPDDVEGWRRLARSYGVLGDAGRADAAWREVLTRAPDDAEARAALDQP